MSKTFVVIVHGLIWIGIAIWCETLVAKFVCFGIWSLISYLSLRGE